MKNDFQKLLGELTAEAETMSKALPADDSTGDKKIQAAAEGGGEDLEKKKEDDKDGEGGEGEMTKSFKVQLADGTEVEAQDGTELVKSLFDRFDESEGVIAKALGATLNLVKSQADAIKSQGALIKSLNEKVSAISGEGRGRKAILTVVEKATSGDATMAKSEDNGMTGQEFLAKSNAAFDAGKITGLQLSTIDVSLRNSVAIDPALVSKVLA